MLVNTIINITEIWHQNSSEKFIFIEIVFFTLNLRDDKLSDCCIKK